MTGVDWAGIIVAGTGLLVAVGSGIKWLVGLVQAQANATIAAKDKELSAKDAYIAVLERVNERRKA
jgi:hypothetical protein